MSSDVKQFDIARWAKLRGVGEDDTIVDIYVLPGDIQRFECDGKNTRIHLLDGDFPRSYVIIGTVEEIEVECNRALGALLEDVKKATNDELIKRGLLKDPPFKMEAN